MALQRLKEGAEKAKIELSSAMETDINLPFVTADASGPKHLNIRLTKAKFESLVDNLVQRTLGPCKVCLKDSGVKKEDLTEVLLVGRCFGVLEILEPFESLQGPKRILFSVAAFWQARHKP